MNIEGMKVVVSGKVAGESRDTAETKLRERGALVQKDVGRDTQLLVTGERVGASKLKKARDLGIDIKPWDEVMGERQGGGKAAAVSPPKARRLSGVRQIGPMLAKAAEELPVGDRWLFEVKWDGYRATASVRGGAVTMQSRSGKSDYAEDFPLIAAELATLPDCILDGEIVMLDDKGKSSFQALTGRAQNGGTAKFIVFDLLEADGRDLRSEKLIDRQRLLAEGLRHHRGLVHIAQSPVFEDGEALMRTAEEQDLEGVIAKDADSTYQEGKRGPSWLKIKVRPRQEFVIVGYTKGLGNREGTAGALVLAVNEGKGKNKHLVYCGMAGTGGTIDDYKNIVGKTKKVEATVVNYERGSFDYGSATLRKFRDVTWVKPELVVEVQFQNWTVDGVLWHPAILGLRNDKKAAEVVRET